MKKNIIAPVLIALCLSVAAYTSISWQTHPGNKDKAGTVTDTIPDKTIKAKDIDEALEELDKAKIELGKQVKEIDMQKIKEDIQKAMQQMEKDLAGMQKELQQAFKEIDEKKIKTQIDAELKKADSEKIKASVDEALAKVDFEKIKLEMEKVRQIDFEKMKKELEAIQPKIEHSMKEARESIEKARKELQGYKSFIDDLHRDGLINKNAPYKVEWQKGELTVNSKKQSSEVAAKYEFLKNKKDFTIIKDADNMSIHNDD